MRKEIESQRSKIVKQIDLIEDFRAYCEDKKYRIYALENRVAPELRAKINELEEVNKKLEGQYKNTT